MKPNPTRTIAGIALIILCGCAPQLEDRNTLILKFGTIEVSPIPDMANLYIVRATNGCIYYVDFREARPKQTLIFESK